MAPTPTLVRLVRGAAKKVVESGRKPPRRPPIAIGAGQDLGQAVQPQRVRRVFACMSRETESEPRSFAYSLSQREDGWAWCVYDEDGLTVANGAQVSRAAALAAIERRLSPSCDEEAAA